MNRQRGAPRPVKYVISCFIQNNIFFEIFRSAAVRFATKWFGEVEKSKFCGLVRLRNFAERNKVERRKISQAFWYRAERWGLIHRIDAALAKIAIFSFIAYTLRTKHMTPATHASFFAVLGGLFGSAYYSDKHSRIEWCCEKHVLYHGQMHVFSIFFGA